MLRKLKWQIPAEPLAARYNWCQGRVPSRGPAVEKRWHRALPGPPAPNWTLEKNSFRLQGICPRFLGRQLCRIITMSTELSLFPDRQWKLKVNLSPFKPREAIRGIGGTAPLTLNLSTIWRWVASITPWQLHLWRRSPGYPVTVGLGGLQRWSGHFGEETYFFPSRL